MKWLKKPRKDIWITFILLILVNVSLPIIGFLLKDIIDSPLWEYPLLLPSVIQIGGLIYLFDVIGFDVKGRGGLIPSPNFLGWLLIVMAVIINLIIHYKLACYISQRRQKKKLLD